jgi:hypothetical protein
MTLISVIKKHSESEGIHAGTKYPLPKQSYVRRVKPRS